MIRRDEWHSYLWSEFDSDAVELVDFVDGQAAIYSRRCPTRQSSPNEDSVCLIEVSEGRGLIAVADGVGGGTVGNEASRCVVECLAEACFELKLNQTHISRGIRSEVIDAIEYANLEILSWGINSATTLTAIELWDDQFRYIHIGDSGALLTSNRGTIKFSTVGHAPVAQAVANGMLDSEEAFDHEDQNVITNCIGTRDMKIEVGIFQPTSERDTLVLASDGLFDNLTHQEIAELIRIGDLQEQTGLLVQTAKERMMTEAGKPDDLSVICFRNHGRE